MARGLARGHCRHLLVTGQRGIGKTTLVDELGRRAALAKIPSLRDVQFLSVNVTDAEPDESRARFLAMLACLTEQAFLPERLPGCRRGDESFNPLSAWLGNLVLVLDGLGALLRGEGGRTNTALFRTVLRRTSMRVIGILSQW